jgi:uncharacterized protein
VAGDAAGAARRCGLKALQIKVKPNARDSVLTPPAKAGEPWQAHLKSPPLEGRANEELVKLVARHFGCPSSQVRIRSGATGRVKWVQVEGLGAADVDGVP